MTRRSKPVFFSVISLVKHKMVAFFHAFEGKKERSVCYVDRKLCFACLCSWCANEMLRCKSIAVAWKHSAYPLPKKSPGTVNRSAIVHDNLSRIQFAANTKNWKISIVSNRELFRQQFI